MKEALCGTPFLLSAWPGFRNIFPATGWAPTMSYNVLGYTLDMTRRFRYDTGQINTRSIVIKDSLTLGATTINSVTNGRGTKHFLQLTLNGPTMSVSLKCTNISIGTGSRGAHSIVDVPSSNQVVAATASLIYRISVADCAETGGTLLDASV